ERRWILAVTGVVAERAAGNAARARVPQRCGGIPRSRGSRTRPPGVPSKTVCSRQTRSFAGGADREPASGRTMVRRYPPTLLRRPPRSGGHCRQAHGEPVSGGGGCRGDVRGGIGSPRSVAHVVLVWLRAG